MKRIISLILALLMLAALAACTAKNDGTETKEPAKTEGETKTEAPAAQEDKKDEAPAEPVEVVLWHTYTDHHQAALEQIIADFNASQSEYKVVAQSQPYSEWDAKLLQSVSTGVGPDMCPMFASDAVGYMNEGYLYDMTSIINETIPDFKEQLAAGLYAEITQWGNSSIYMMPVTMTSEVLYYNKTWLDELGISVPTTWTEVEVAAKAIHEKYGVAGFGTDSITDTFQGWLMQSGSQYIDVASKQIALNEETALKYLNWFADGVKEGYFRLVGEDYYFSNPFGSEAVGMYVGSAAGVDYAAGAIPAEGEAGHFEMGVAPLPQEGPVKYISSWGSTYVCLSKDEAHAKGVAAFIKYFTSKEVLPGWAKSFGAVPARKESMESEDFQAYAAENKAVKALVEEFDYINYLPAVAGAATVRTEIDKMVQSVALGLSDAKTAYDAFVAASNAALND